MKTLASGSCSEVLFHKNARDMMKEILPLPARVVIKHQTFWEEIIAYFPFTSHELQRKRARQYYLCCVCIHCCGSAYIELLPSNSRRGGVNLTDPYGRILGFLDLSRYFFLPSSSSVVLTRLSGPRSRSITPRKIWWCRETKRASGSVARNSWPLDTEAV
jgi:hypothetical protein